MLGMQYSHFTVSYFVFDPLQMRKFDPLEPLALNCFCAKYRQP
jgi:hypothetical protein